MEYEVTHQSVIKETEIVVKELVIKAFGQDDWLINWNKIKKKISMIR